MSIELFDGAGDRVALVTGAASGIGAATASFLAEQGIGGLVLVDRDGEALGGLAATLPDAAGTPLMRIHDVADEAAWEETARAVRHRYGRLDLAVANAGIAEYGPIAGLAFDAWRRVMAVNLDGVFLTLQCAMRLIGAGARGGAIVVVGSVASRKAEAETAAYGAAKAGAACLARVAAREGANDGIRVNAVLPGGVTTPLWRGMAFFDDLVASEGSEAAAFAAMAAEGTPLGRFADAREIATQIALLLSDRSAAMTGAEVVVDGGYSL